ncbi:MAG: hypothetical protein AAGG07_07825 [Planctomycetota bacterium]
MHARLNTVCYTTSLVSLLLAALLTISMIWFEQAQEEVIVKSMLTCAVLFATSAGVLIVNSTLGRLMPHRTGTPDGAR